MKATINWVWRSQCPFSFVTNAASTLLEDKVTRCCFEISDCVCLHFHLMYPALQKCVFFTKYILLLAAQNRFRYRQSMLKEYQPKHTICDLISIVFTPYFKPHSPRTNTELWAQAVYNGSLPSKKAKNVFGKAGGWLGCGDWGTSVWYKIEGVPENTAIKINHISVLY